MGCRTKQQTAELKQQEELNKRMRIQMSRARAMAADVYSKVFANDPELLKFLLDRLERVEKAQSVAHETICRIDWAL